MAGLIGDPYLGPTFGSTLAAADTLRRSLIDFSRGIHVFNVGLALIASGTSVVHAFVMPFGFHAVDVGDHETAKAKEVERALLKLVGERAAELQDRQVRRFQAGTELRDQQGKQ